MSKYFCHNCAVKLGISLPAETEVLTGNEYQLEKFLKHTAPTVRYPLVSIFDHADFETYENYTISAAASGWVEEDDQGRINMAWYAGKNTGATYKNGMFILPTDCVKVVFHNNVFKIHAFPNKQSDLITAKCSRCSIDIPYER
jgi:hypothetical protein